MIKDVRYIKNIFQGIAHIRLFGDFGEEINGVQVAYEIGLLSDSIDVTEIYLHINSPGGKVFDGLSIMAAMRNSEKPITTINEGICASIAAVVAFSGQTVKAVDFARYMIHNASSSDPNAEKEITIMISEIIAKRGINIESVAEYMNNETWFPATMAQSIKLIDEIIPIPTKIHSLNKLEILNKLNISNKMNEQKIMELLGVSTPEEIQAAIENLIAQLNEYKTKEQEMEDACKEKAEAEAKAAVDKAIENKVATEEEREGLMEMAKINLPVFNKLTAIPEKEEKQTIKNNFKFQGKTEKTDNELKEEFASNLKAGTLVDYQSKVGEEVFNKSMNLYYAKNK